MIRWLVPRLRTLGLLLFLAAEVFAGVPEGLDRPLPVDSAVTIGKLKNGLTYYIRENHKPEKRAELRLVVNAGSVLEDDSQQGLAHFVEHMAFDGTKNFKKKELVDYLESVGVRFGADLNASTSFDQTIFMFQIPTDTLSILEKGFDILEDWAHLIRFEPEDIEKERGVVIEEWRLGRGAEARIRDKQFPVIFKNSRYADRLPIGKKEILESFSRTSLLRFYNDWYRPDLMAVVAVGDFDRATIEALILRHFQSVPAPAAERPRTEYPVPDTPGTLFAIATDPEATIARAGIMFKRPVDSDTLVSDYRRGIVERLYLAMLNSRLSEISRQKDPPYVYARSTSGRLVRTKEFYELSAVVKTDRIRNGLAAILTEAARVKQFGFTATELKREKDELLRSMESAYLERDKTESEDFAAEYIRNFLGREPIPGIGSEFAMYREFLPGISLNEVNEIATHWVSDSNRVVTVSAPASVRNMPTEAQLGALIDSVGRITLTPYDDKVSLGPLIPVLPTAGTIVKQIDRKEIGVTEWELSNGARVVLKPTDFKNDEILFTAFAPGGTSLAPDSLLIPATTASGIIQQCGIGQMDQNQYQKFLTGKLVGVSPYIDEIEEGFSGGASPKDAATLFELLYLYATAPRMDSAAYVSWKARVRASIENRSARPEAAFSDTVMVTFAQHHVRRQPFTTVSLDNTDLQKSFEFYNERFSHAGDFTYIFVGSFTIEQLTPFILTYIGGLPRAATRETWKDPGIVPPRGVIEKTVRRGIEPKSRVMILFNGPFAWSQEALFDLNAMSQVLTIKMREALREDKGGTYGVSVGASGYRDPRREFTAYISFGCDPARVDELVRAAFAQLDSITRFGVGATYLTKVKETSRREYETGLKQNRNWLASLKYYYSVQQDPGLIIRQLPMLERITSANIRKSVAKYFDRKNYLRVTLLPATMPSSKASGKSPQ